MVIILYTHANRVESYTSCFRTPRTCFIGNSNSKAYFKAGLILLDFWFHLQFLSPKIFFSLVWFYETFLWTTSQLSNMTWYVTYKIDGNFNSKCVYLVAKIVDFI